MVGLTQLSPDIEFAAILKLHTKRSPHRNDGGHWFQHFVEGLLPSGAAADSVLDEFATQPGATCMVAARGSLVPIGDWLEETGSPKSFVFASEHRPADVGKLEYPAGSMMWMNMDVWRALGRLDLSPADFEPELGQLDETRASHSCRICDF